MGDTMTDEELAAAEACLDLCARHGPSCRCADCVRMSDLRRACRRVNAREALVDKHVPALLAEVKRLREDSDTWRYAAKLGDRTLAHANEAVDDIAEQRDAALAEVKRLRDVEAAYGRLRWGVVANAGRLSTKAAPRWAHVMEATGYGSASATELCVAAGFDPHEQCGAPPDATDWRSR